MKASLKVRENQNPFLKAKIPVKILGLSFRSSIEASADTKELCLSFSTLFQSGPLCKLNYRPNDPSSPFGLVLKTGVGPFGSPIGAPFSISAEFNFLGNKKNPSFVLHFKPQIGDFAITERVVPGIHFPSAVPHDLGSGNGVVSENSDNEGQEKMTWSRMFSSGFAAAERVAWRGMDVSARTVVPVRDLAVVNLRWGVRFPAAAVKGDNDRWARMMPYLVLNKIGIEHVEEGGKLRRERDSGENENGFGDVAEACLGVKREVDVLRNESMLLKKEFDKFKSEIAGWHLEKYGSKKPSQENIL